MNTEMLKTKAFSDNATTTQSEMLNGTCNPKGHNSEGKSSILFFFKVLYCVLSIVPIILHSFIKQFFISSKSLKGNIVLVTGSGRGLGQNMAMKFAKLGCKVACVDINEATNQETVRMINEQYPGKAKAYKCNVASPQDIRALKKSVYSDFGQVHVLVHNAGLVAYTSATDFTDSFAQNVIAVNLTSHCYMIREFLPDMIERNEGHYVAVASLGGFMGTLNGSIYAATKHGVVGLMDSLSMELNGIPNNNVKTSVVCPFIFKSAAFNEEASEINIPILSIDYVANSAIAGILKNTKIIAVPSVLYYVINLRRFLPDRVTDMIIKTFHPKLQTIAIKHPKIID